MCVCVRVCVRARAKPYTMEFGIRHRECDCTCYREHPATSMHTYGVQARVLQFHGRQFRCLLRSHCSCALEGAERALLWRLPVAFEADADI